jgi:hypothetical protein
VDHLHRGLRRLLAPEVLEQRVDGHGAAGLEQQAREQRALSRPAERQRPPTGAGLERPEDEEVGARGATLSIVAARIRQLAHHRPDLVMHIALVVTEVVVERPQRGLHDPHLRRRELDAEGGCGDVVVEHGPHRLLVPMSTMILRAA